MGRRDLAARAGPVGGDGVPVSAGSATTGDLPLQACPDPGNGLSVVAAEYPPAAPPAHCPGVGGAISCDLRDAARVASASLYRGRPPRAGHRLLAEGGPAGHRALGEPGSDWASDHRAG